MFFTYSVFSRWYNANLIDVPLKAPNYDLDVDGILNAMSSKTKVLFLASPNNPTGTFIAKETLQRLLDNIPTHVLVVFDEVYRHFATAKSYTTALPYVLKGYNVLGLNSFSKTYGLAGMRIGYGYTTKTIAQYLRLIQKPFLLPQPSIEAAIGALNDVAFVEKTVATVHEEKDYLSKEFKALGIKFWPSEANFFIIDPPLEEMEFTNALMEYGIMVRPVSQFGAPGKVRISVGDNTAKSTFNCCAKRCDTYLKFRKNSIGSRIIV